MHTIHFMHKTDNYADIYFLNVQKYDKRSNIRNQIQHFRFNPKDFLKLNQDQKKYFQNEIAQLLYTGLDMINWIQEEGYRSIDIQSEVKIYWHKHVLTEKNSHFNSDWNCDGRVQFDKCYSSSEKGTIRGDVKAWICGRCKVYLCLKCIQISHYVEQNKTDWSRTDWSGTLKFIKNEQGNIEALWPEGVLKNDWEGRVKRDPIAQ